MTSVSPWWNPSLPAPLPEEIDQARIPTVADVDRITAFRDPVVRNLQITQCYHELSEAFARRTGPIANWCTFATWASKQAGQTIRQEDLIRVFENLLVSWHERDEIIDQIAAGVQCLRARIDTTALRASVWQVLYPAVAFELASDAVARGNRKVFEEIGRAFARFLALFGDDLAFDPGKIAQFCDELKPGDPPEGQRYLRQAFTRYYQSFFESNPKARAELMLLATIEVGLHEQTRLQPEINEALDAPLTASAASRQRLLAALLPHLGLFPQLRLFIAWLLGRKNLFDAACDLFVDRLRDHTHRTITECLMTLAWPGGELLRLGRDLQAGFPEMLRQIMNAELQALLRNVDPTPDSVYGSGTEDWGNLPQRLHYIADLFRCYQEQHKLLSAPFTEEQAALLKTGIKPGGQL